MGTRMNAYLKLDECIVPGYVQGTWGDRQYSYKSFEKGDVQWRGSGKVHKQT
jgi:hypothetical protein